MYLCYVCSNRGSTYLRHVMLEQGNTLCAHWPSQLCLHQVTLCSTLRTMSTFTKPSQHAHKCTAASLLLVLYVCATNRHPTPAVPPWPSPAYPRALRWTTSSRWPWCLGMCWSRRCRRCGGPQHAVPWAQEHQGGVLGLSMCGDRGRVCYASAVPQTLCSSV
jgi:hypothetical protein